LPKDSPSEFTVDVSSLDLGQAIHVKDLVIPPEVKVLTPAEMTVAAVTVLKKEAEPVAAEAAAEAVPGEGAAAEPELIKKERAEDAEGEKAEKPEKGEKGKPEKAEKKEKK
jgi:large subunit ribosomal protein L25